MSINNPGKKLQLSCENILSPEYCTMSGYTSKTRRATSSINSRSILRTGASDPCILSSLGEENSELNEISSFGGKSVDSGVPGSQLSHVDQVSHPSLI